MSRVSIDPLTVAELEAREAVENLHRIALNERSRARREMQGVVGITDELVEAVAGWGVAVDQPKTHTPEAVAHAAANLRRAYDHQKEDLRTAREGHIEANNERRELERHVSHLRYELGEVRDDRDGLLEECHRLEEESAQLRQDNDEMAGDADRVVQQAELIRRLQDDCQQARDQASQREQQVANLRQQVTALQSRLEAVRVAVDPAVPPPVSR